MRVRCGPGFLLLLALLALMDGGEAVLPWAALAAAVHELGHYAAVRLQGGAVKDLCLSLSGGALVLAPAASLLGDGGEGSSLLAGLSLCLGWFNLLPVWPLDGGRALLLILSGFLPHDQAEVWVFRCSLALGAGLLAGGGSLLWRGGGPTLLLMGGWLLLCQRGGRKLEN